MQQELGSARSIDDFFGQEGIFAQLFVHTLEHRLEAELTAHLGYERHAPEGRNSGNNRNGKRSRTLRTSVGDTPSQVPRDRHSTFHSPLLETNQRKVTKTKGAFPTDQAMCKLRFLVTRDITQKWLSPKLDFVHGAIRAD